ncbi:hypothetical protein [Curtobacterium flaccumfaciens]|uniref:hypothetical protein n=1 Tax=Curtobacterium flaccumfaciens TaxID=2035 RepID=UPI00399152A6
MSGNQDQGPTTGASGAVRALTAVLREAGRADAPFGAEQPSDEAAFLRAVDALLAELDVQFAARGFRSGSALTAVRSEVVELLDRLQSATTTCGCEHGIRQHRTTGCQWENTLGTDHCDCVALVSGLAPVQVRAYLEQVPAAEAF